MIPTIKGIDREGTHGLPDANPEPHLPPNASDPSFSTQTLIASTVGIFQQGEALLAGLSDELYARRLQVAMDASIGSHYRHCLDHFQNLLRCAQTGEVDYDCRERDPRLENERLTALAATQRLSAALSGLPVEMWQRPVQVRSNVAYGDLGPTVTQSTFGREAVYVVAHAIHHFAMITIICRSVGLKLPPHFGVAPSTLQHQQRATAA